MPSHPRRRDKRCPLPPPAERLRVRRAWQLTEVQVAQAFGVTAATVRSWETGRTSPAGARRAAYAAFLAGLSQGLASDATTGHAVSHGDGPSPRRCRTTPATKPPSVAEQRPVPRHRDRVMTVATTLLPRACGPVTGLDVGPRPDPVSPARLRRFRLMAAGVGVWIAVGYLLATVPVVHL
ncbi:helix-turn-helix domain-containing protein [Streptomyces sp. KL116D]|uniref:helix-turn-helix domain-containing protein n=1 Tax=Streptomyces sp. KL116D TaxID=3045152 RepID=UPI003556979A